MSLEQIMVNGFIGWNAKNVVTNIRLMGQTYGKENVRIVVVVDHK